MRAHHLAVLSGLTVVLAACVNLDDVPTACTADPSSCDGNDAASSDSSPSDSTADTTTDAQGDMPVDDAVDSNVDGSDVHDASLDSDTSTGSDADGGVDARICSPGAYQCAGAGGNELQQCAADGKAYTLAATCPTSATCSASMGRCTSCTPGALSCSGQQLMKCDSTGAGSGPSGSACPAATICDPKGTGQCDICVENAVFCTSAALKHCSSDGQSSSLLDTCGTAELCASSTGDVICKSPTCAASAKRCSGKITQVCNPGLTGWSDVTICPVDCSGGACLTVIDATTRDGHTCALLSDRTLRCWGQNEAGELGIGTTSSGPTPSPTPVAITSVASIVTGGTHSCAVLTTGSVSCWGDNSYGQLGIGPSTPRLSPVAVAITSVKSLALGFSHTCALITDGTVKCWGNNYYGQLGIGSVVAKDVPTPLPLTGVQDLVAGEEHTCTRSSDGSVRCWGNNTTGALGDGSTVSKSSPVLVPGISGVLGIGSGRYHACAILSDRLLKCWGRGAALGASSDVLSPTLVSSVGGVLEMQGGPDHSCVLTNTGAIKCWGSGYWGELGDGTFTSHVDAVYAGAGFATLRVGGYTSCGVTSTGILQCWGQNNYGELGDGTIVKSGVPINVVW